MNKNIFGYCLFILGNIFLLIGLDKISVSETDLEIWISFIFIVIALVECFYGIKFIINKKEKE